MPIFSCRNCVPPERHPGCHGTCAKYLKEKAEYDALKEADDKKKQVQNGLTAQRNKVYYRAMKHRRTKDR
jgi:hypothetical protein